VAKPSKATLDVVWERDLSRCFRCQRGLHRGQGGYSIHHRRPRGMGGSRDPRLNEPANLILLCGSGVDGCHGWVEQNRDMARQLGFLVPLVGSLSPDQVPVKRWGQQWVTLLPTGDMIVGL
jgi:hypothetical protein